MRTLCLEVCFSLPLITFTPTIDGPIRTEIDCEVDENPSISTRDICGALIRSATVIDSSEKKTVD